MAPLQARICSDCCGKTRIENTVHPPCTAAAAQITRHRNVSIRRNDPRARVWSILRGCERVLEAVSAARCHARAPQGVRHIKSIGVAN